MSTRGSEKIYLWTKIGRDSALKIRQIKLCPLVALSLLLLIYTYISTSRSSLLCYYIKVSPFPPEVREKSGGKGIGVCDVVGWGGGSDGGGYSVYVCVCAHT